MRPGLACCHGISKPERVVECRGVLLILWTVILPPHTSGCHQGGVVYVDNSKRIKSFTRLVVVPPLEPFLWRMAALVFEIKIKEKEYVDK